jgi:hypothetical protein
MAKQVNPKHAAFGCLALIGVLILCGVAVTKVAEPPASPSASLRPTIELPNAVERSAVPVNQEAFDKFYAWSASTLKKLQSGGLGHKECREGVCFSSAFQEGRTRIGMGDYGVYFVESNPTASQFEIMVVEGRLDWTKLSDCSMWEARVLPTYIWEGCTLNAGPFSGGTLTFIRHVKSSGSKLSITTGAFYRTEVDRARKLAQQVAKPPPAR